MKAEFLQDLAVRALREGADLRLQLIDHSVDALVRAAETIAECFQRGGKVLLFGNGGSAADAQHIAAEFVGRFAREREGLPAIALTTDTSILTAVGNDFGFERVFARQVEALGRPGDVAVAISTSGRSPNVLAGVRAAREKGLATIGLTGGGGGPLADMVEIAIVVPSRSTPRIQECHIALGHILCELVETLLFGYKEDPMKERGRSIEEIEADIRPGSKVVSWDTLLALREKWRTTGKTVVWTNGCFDLLHVGHIRFLQMAKAQGDVLIVGVNGDDSVRQLKGPGRPILQASQRAELLAALECVDYVVIFDELTPEGALSRLKPEIHCKGADYAPPHGKPIPEAKVVESYGGRVVFLPLVPLISTSELIRRIREGKGEASDDEAP